MKDIFKSAPRCGYVAIVGAPNVGKSTLLNTILGEKLAIVSRTAQTTRNRIVGVKVVGNCQFVFVDTPGIHRATSDFNRYMVREAVASLREVDCHLLVTAVTDDKQRTTRGKAAKRPLRPADRFALATVRNEAETQATIVALNKVDRLGDRTALLPQISNWSEAGHDTIVPISALRGDGIDRLLEEIAARLPEGQHVFPDDMLTDRAERWLAAEMVREQVLRHCTQEVPHATAVDVEGFEERPDRGDIVIDANIYVERDSQKAIVIGAKGSMIAKIGTEARKVIGEQMMCPVHLRLNVRVASEWRRSATGRRRFGYE